MIYLLPIMFSSILFFINLSINKSISVLSYDFIIKFAVVVSSLPFIFLTSLRWNTGFDWFPYYDYFTSLVSSKSYIQSWFEPLFSLFTYVVSRLTGNYNVYLFIVSLFSIIVFVCWIKLVPENGSKLIAFISSYSFILPFYMGALRQSIAIAISSVGLLRLINKKQLSAIFLFLIATFFHYSAVLNFVYFFIFTEKIFQPKYRFFLYFLASFPLILFVAFGILVNIQNVIVQRIVSYIGFSATSSEINYLERNTLLIIERMLFLVFFLLLVRNIDGKEDERESKFLITMLFTYVFSTIFYISALFTFRNLAGRGIVYFRISDVVLLSIIPKYSLEMLIGNLSNEEKLIMGDYLRIVVLLILYFYQVFRFIFVVINANSMFYLPYKNILGF